MSEANSREHQHQKICFKTSKKQFPETLSTINFQRKRTLKPLNAGAGHNDGWYIFGHNFPAAGARELSCSNPLRIREVFYLRF